MSDLLWTRRSLANIVSILKAEEVHVCATTVSKWLRSCKYSLRINSKCISRTSPPERNAQFEKIKRLRNYCEANNVILLSVDTKKKELIGKFANRGAVWCKHPIRVNDHDFRSLGKGIAIPYGVYDLQYNKARVYLGDSSDTPEFAVDCIAHWFNTEGRKRYPNATRIVILADCGGSNSNRSYAWKYFLQKKVSDPFQLQVTVAHYPAGSSKWNPIERRVFGPISINWAGRPLDDIETIMNYISTTTNKSGLVVDSVRVTKQYKKGIKISKKEMKTLHLVHHKKQPKLNYDIYARQ